MTRALQPTPFKNLGGGPLSVTYTGGVAGQDSFFLILDTLRFKADHGGGSRGNDEHICNLQANLKRTVTARCRDTGYIYIYSLESNQIKMSK